MDAIMIVPKTVDTAADEKATIKLFNNDSHKASDDLEKSSLYQIKLTFVNSEPLLPLNE